MYRDTIRDKILLTAGDITFDISDTAKSVAPFTNFAKRKAVNNKLNTFLIVTGKHRVDRWRKRN